MPPELVAPGLRSQIDHVLDALTAFWPLWLTRVEGRSMEPTLHHGRLVPTRRLGRTDHVRRGDLVVVDSRRLGRRVVKRVIGLPRECVEIVDGQVIVDGRLLDEEYARPSVFNGRYSVPDGAFFLLGDNRDASTDSRSWEQPFARRDELTGRGIAGLPMGRDVLPRLLRAVRRS